MRAIEVFADIWCPFAHLGLRAVAQRRDELGRGDVPMVVRAWPLELINDEPQDPKMAAEHVADLRAQCAPDAFAGFRSEERRVGKECGSTCRSRGSPYP